jgi:hypothetical protein
MTSDEGRPQPVPPCWGRFLRSLSCVATSPISSDLQPVLCRRVRTWSIRNSADQDRCNRFRCRSASCDPGTSGRAAARWLETEPCLQTCDAPAAPPDADRCRFDGCDGASTPALPCPQLSNIAHASRRSPGGLGKKCPRRPGASSAQEFCHSAARDEDSRTEQYCSAKGPDMDQYPSLQGDLLNKGQE